MGYYPECNRQYEMSYLMRPVEDSDQWSLFHGPECIFTGKKESIEKIFNGLTKGPKAFSRINVRFHGTTVVDMYVKVIYPGDNPSNTPSFDFVTKSDESTFLTELDAYKYSDQLRLRDVKGLSFKVIT